MFLLHNEMTGMPVTVYANQADREGVVLVGYSHNRKSWALAEYVMPAGRTFLRLLPLDEHGNMDPDGGRSVSYNALPKGALLALRANADAVLPLIRGGFDREVAPDSKGWHRRRIESEHTKAANVIASVLYGS